MTNAHFMVGFPSDQRFGALHPAASATQIRRAYSASAIILYRVSQLNVRPDALSEDVHLVEIIKRFLIGASLAAVVIYILNSA
jgi:hypothetical protein